MSTNITKIACPSCGAPVSQLSPDAQTLICNKCGSYIALDMDGPTVTSKGPGMPRSEFPIAVGDIAKLQGTEFIVLGRVHYRGWDDEDKWTWDEWLMGAADGRLLWMSYSSDEGFTLFRKLRIREPFDAQTSDALPVGDGKRVRVHERYPAQIVAAQGELTWRAKAGDRFHMAEAFGHGKRYSVQQTTDELEIHEGDPLTPEEVATAFNNTEWLAKIKSASDRSVTMAIIGVMFVIFAVLGFGASIWAATTGEPTLNQTLTLNRASPVATIPIDFDQTSRASIVSVSAQGLLPLPSSVDIDVSIDSPDGTENDLFTLELWRESGYDDEGYWEEAQDNASDMFVPFQQGTHNLEITMGETTIESITIGVNVRRNHVLPTWFLIYGAVIGVIGVIIIIMSLSTKKT